MDATVGGLRACCVSGHKAEGTPQGKFMKVGGVNTYVAAGTEGGSPPTKAVVVATDAFGAQFVNNQLLADDFAREGFMCVVPDLFAGKPVPAPVMETVAVKLSGVGLPKPRTLVETLGAIIRKTLALIMLLPIFVPFMIKNNPKSKVGIIEPVIKELKEKHGIKKVAAVGYCYGATPVLALVQRGVVEAFGIAHGRMTASDASGVKVPGMLQVADNDPGMSYATRDSIDAVFKGREDSQKFELQFYPSTYHGFAVRGDPKDKHLQEAKAESLRSFVAFFNKHM